MWVNTVAHRELDPSHLRVDNLAFELRFKGGGKPQDWNGILKFLTVYELNSMTAIDVRDVAFDAMDLTSHVRKATFRYQDKVLIIEHLKSEKDGEGHIVLDFGDIHLVTNNGKPARNKVNPARGAFDTGHLNMHVSLHAHASHLSRDSFAIRIDSLKATEAHSGINLRRLSLDANVNRSSCDVTNLSVSYGEHTTLSVPRGHLVIPRKDLHRPLSFRADNLSCHVVLKDISKAFVPALAHFTTPLDLTVDVEGSNRKFLFNSIKVSVPDHRLAIKSDGCMEAGENGTVDLHFDIHDMYARRGVKEQIIKHFAKGSKKTVASLDGLLKGVGDITFKGSVDIPMGREVIKGHLNTAIGRLYADVTLDDKTAMMVGHARSDSIHLGKLLSNRDLGKVVFNADFSFDIAGKEKARKLHRKQGKLPIGYINGKAVEANWKFVKIHNITFHINSNGEVATGTLANDGKLMDVSADFSFTNTNFDKSLKVTPHVKVHNVFRKVFGKKIIR